jgi:hypothetical protein
MDEHYRRQVVREVVVFVLAIAAGLFLAVWWVS